MLHPEARQAVHQLIEANNFSDLIEIIGAYAAQQATQFREGGEADPQGDYWERTFYACSMALGVYSAENVIPMARRHGDRMQKLALPTTPQD
jgi:hypothetical protein